VRPRTAIAVLVLAGVLVLGGCALLFDAGTLLFVGAAMLIVAFFAGSWVLLGVLSRGRHRAGRNQPDDAEVIHDEPGC
jgi:hypothetical protein